MTEQSKGIYALSQNGVVRYVGQSYRIEHRYKQHCSIFQNKGNTKRERWIAKLLRNNTTPDLVVLEITGDLDSREIYWINYYKGLNNNLVNTADGGTTNGHMLRAKKDMPWGNGWTPLQRFLINSKSDIKIVSKYGNKEMSDRLQQKFNNTCDVIYKTINRIGKDEFNLRLWEKWGNNL